MRVGRRAFLTATAAAIAIPTVLRLGRAAAQPTVLKLHHSFSAVSSVHEKFLAPWARKIEAECGGRIRIDLFPSMQLGGAPVQLFDQARDGVADIVWTAPADTPGRFVKIEAFELPFLPSRRALVNSKALEDFAAAYLQDEFREVHPLCFSCRDRGIVHANRAIHSLADLRGVRLHVANRVAAAAVERLGARGVGAPIAQLQAAVSSRVLDGCLDPWDALPSLRLSDLVKFHTDFAEGALSTTAFILAMNKAAYDRLPREVTAVFDANSGQAAATMAGAMWDLDANAVADTAATRGDTIIVLAPEEVTRWRKATEPVIGTWLKAMKDRKLDGNRMLASARALIAKYANEPEPQTARPPPQQPQPQQTQRTPPQPQDKVVSGPPQAAASPPQAKADVTAAPTVGAPAAAPTPKRPTPKVLDIPM